MIKILMVFVVLSFISCGNDDTSDDTEDTDTNDTDTNDTDTDTSAPGTFNFESQMANAKIGRQSRSNTTTCTINDLKQAVVSVDASTDQMVEGEPDNLNWINLR